MSTDIVEQAQTLLRDQGAELSPQWRATVDGLVQRCLDQERLLQRLTRIADGFQAAERQRGQSYLARYERQVRQLEKIVRISDRYQAMLRELTERLEHASNNDPLTDLPNRRSMSARLAEAVALAERQRERSFALALGDIDHFKRVNDTHGHTMGDQVLVAVARALRATLRDYDHCARWGGEEFLVFLPECGLAQAVAIAQRLRQAVAELDVLPAGHVTMSLGVTVHTPGTPLDETLRRADAALYQAKAAGRDRVEALEP